MWRDIIVVLGLIITVLAWCGITPRRLGKVTKQHVIKKPHVVITALITCLSVFAILYHLHTGANKWWLYAEATSWSAFWWATLVSESFLKRRAWGASLLFLMVAPMFLLFGPLPRLNSIFQSYSTENILHFSQLSLWLIAATIFFVGGITSTNIIYWIISRRLDVFKSALEEASSKKRHD